MKMTGQLWKLVQQKEQYLHSAVATGQGYLSVSQGLSVPQQLIHLRGGEESSGLPAGQTSSLS